MTLEKAKELFGELPKDVLEESADYGEEYCKENRVALISAWDLIRTLA